MEERRVERTIHVDDEVVDRTETMVSEGGPPVPGEPVGPDRVSRERWEYYDATAARERTAGTLIQAIYFVFGVIEALIGIRIVLRLLGANPNNAFADFIYSVTGPFIAPFAGIFGTPSSDGYVLELHSILALVIYALVAYLLAALVRLVMQPGTHHEHHSHGTRIVH